MIHIEVLLIDPDTYPMVVYCELPRGTVQDAIYAAGFQLQFEHDALMDLQVSVFGRKAKWTTPLVNGDRVELAPKLRIDPKQARRLRASSD